MCQLCFQEVVQLWVCKNLVGCLKLSDLQIHINHLIRGMCPTYKCQMSSAQEEMDNFG